MRSGVICKCLKIEAKDLSVDPRVDRKFLCILVVFSQFSTRLFPDEIDLLGQIPEDGMVGRCQQSMKEKLSSARMIFLHRYRSYRSYNMDYRGGEFSLNL